MFGNGNKHLSISLYHHPVKKGERESCSKIEKASTGRHRRGRKHCCCFLLKREDIDLRTVNYEKVSMHEESVSVD